MIKLTKSEMAKLKGLAEAYNFDGGPTPQTRHAAQRWIAASRKFRTGTKARREAGLALLEQAWQEAVAKAGG